MLDAQDVAQHLNTCCACNTLDRQKLEYSLTQRIEPPLAQSLKQTHPHLFADVRAYLGRSELDRMASLVSAVDKITQHPAYLAAVSAREEDSVWSAPSTRGAFGSFDFHMTPDGPALIEINTNAGGAFLAAAGAASHDPCCEPDEWLVDMSRVRAFGDRVVDMFLSEWRLAGRPGVPSLIAIVDDDPCSQYLYPEFLLARDLLVRHGVDAVVVDPSAFRYDGGLVLADGRRVDLVYNRLTDFTLDEPRHAALRRGGLEDAVVITPHPFHHAIHAHKHNLVLLKDKAVCDQVALDAAERQALNLIPESLVVTPENADMLWQQRKHYYFKPVAGHAAKGVYRGAKITHAVWNDISTGGYIAQRAVPPSERLVRTPAGDMSLKMDFRIYTYGAEIIFVAARLYQGQTTNMRTPGGGFAPVTII